MKQFVLSVVLCAAAASALPARYIIIPLDDVEFVDQPAYAPSMQQSYPQMMYNHRVARQLSEEEPVYSSPISSRPQQVANRREGIPSFIDAIGAAGIPGAADNLASGSSAYSAPPQGVDYVDYGAYTGKHGAFGWYSDHPVCLNCH